MVGEDRYGELDGIWSGINHYGRRAIDVGYSTYHYLNNPDNVRDRRFGERTTYPTGDFNGWDPQGPFPMMGGVSR